ncbi:MAG: tetratricopeptide repeat protein, partial [Acidobacteriota bacterium]
PEKDRLVVLASKAYIERNYEEASKQLDRYLDLYPDEKEALFTRGDWYYHFGEVEKAKDYFLRVLKLDPNFDRATNHLIWVYQSTGESQKAIAVAKEYALRAKTADAIRQLYDASIRAGDFDGAEESLNRAEAIAPPEAAVEINKARGELLSYRGKYEEAEKLCRTMLEPGDSSGRQIEGYGCLVNIFAYTGQFRKAIEAQQSQIDLRLRANEVSKLSDDYATLSYLYLWGLNDRSRAEETVEKSLHYAGDSEEILHVLFDVLTMLGRSEDAARIVHQSLWGHRPWTTETIRAMKNFNNRNYQEAISDFKLLAEKGHTFDRIFSRYMIGQIYIEIGQYDRAMETLQEVVATPLSRT